MSERKVINKYIAPDFDPAALPARVRPSNGQIKVRVMLPCSVQCNFCGDYVYKGKKFNARSEICKEDYLGIKMFRFYIKCTTCSSEIVFRTDPQSSDYVVEGGATRNFEPWKQSTERDALEKSEKEFEERGDAMKLQENRTLASKREMDVADALDEIRELNARHAHLDTEETISRIRESRAEQELAEKQKEAANAAEEEEVAKYFGPKTAVEKRLSDRQEETTDTTTAPTKRLKSNLMTPATAIPPFSAASASVSLSAASAAPAAVSSSAASAAPSASGASPSTASASSSSSVQKAAPVASKKAPAKPLFIVKKKASDPAAKKPAAKEK